MDPLYLTHLPKHGRGRMKNIQTFRASCDSGDKSGATAWLTSTHTLKGPEEAAYNSFVHVMKGLLRDHPVVIKLQEVSRLSEKEATIATLLSGRDTPNVAVPICEFKCKNDLIEWKQPLVKGVTKQFCSGKTDMTSVFVMEYIHHNLIDFLSSDRSGSIPISTPIYISILKQLGFALANLHINLKITHGDIGSGNMMLELAEPRTIRYTINGIDYDVDTFGYEPILIDYQRSVRYSGEPDPAILADEIAIAFDIVAHWTKGKPVSISSVIEALSASDISQLDILNMLAGM